MAETFYTILTNIGKAKIATAAALGTDINIAKFAVGDGNGAYYNPTENQISLKHEVWRGNATSVNVDPENPNWIVCQSVITTTEGGFMIREAAIFDIEGDMIAVGKYPETYKPLLAEGSAKDLNVKMIIEVSNASTVTLKVNTSVLFATKEELNALAGTERTTETIKKNANDIAALAGAGRTTETVKGNADAIANLRENFDEHKADNTKHLPSGGTVGQIVQKQSSGWGLVDLPPSKDVDNGRYQAEWRLEDAVLSGCEMSGIDINMWITKTIQQIQQDSTQYVPSYATMQAIGQKLTNTTDIDQITSVTIYTYKSGNPLCNVTVSIFDKTSGTTLGSKSIPSSAIPTSLSPVKFIFDTPINFVKGHELHIRIDNQHIGDAGNLIFYGYKNSNVLTDGNYITSNSLTWTTTDEVATADLEFILEYRTLQITGTATKTVTPSDLKKWGNVKWTQNTPANTGVVCDVESVPINGDVADSNITITNALSIYNVNWRAGKFIALKDAPKVRIKVLVYKNGSPTTPLEVHIYNSSSGNPSSSLGSVTIDAQSTASYIEIDISLSSPLVQGNTYFVVLRTSGGDSNNYYMWQGKDNTTGGNNFNSSNNGSTWASDSTKIMCFQVGAIAILKSNITSIADLSDIDITQYPSLALRWTLSRNSVEDSSPTVSDVSVTWEGNGKKSAYGEFQNLNMISISPNNDFTFTIPLGIFAKHGRANLCSNVAGSSGAQVMFTTDSSQSQSQVTGSGVSSSGSAYRGNDALTTTGQFGGNIKLKSMYISSMNLIVTFNNISTSVTSSLSNVYILWEVFI